MCRGILYRGQHNVLLVPSKTVALHLCIRWVSLLKSPKQSEAIAFGIIHWIKEINNSFEWACYFHLRHTCKDATGSFYSMMRSLKWKGLAASGHQVLNFRLRDIQLGPVVRSLVSTNPWLRAIKTYRFPWYLTVVSANHASSNPGLKITNEILLLPH